MKEEYLYIQFVDGTGLVLAPERWDKFFWERDFLVVRKDNIDILVAPKRNVCCCYVRED